MGNIYIAVNGDDVGSRIGQAIANDDHESLTQATSSIQSAHESIDQWINSIGGKKISSAGDDAIYMVPEQAVNDLDDVRAQYKEESGHGLTIGVGPSMSQASKALIYGKMNGKDQTIHYEPAIEDYLSDEDEDQPDVPAEDELQDQADADMEADSGSGALEYAPPQEDVDDSDSAVPGAEAPDMDADPAASMEDDSEIPEAGTEDDISEDDQTATDAPAEPVANKTPAQQANKAPQANTPPVDGKTDKDFGTSEDDMSEDSQDESAAPAMSGEEDMPDDDQEEDAANADADGGPVAEDAADDVSDDDMDGSSVHDPASQGEDHDELSDEDVAQPEDEDNGEDPLASMIHGDMQGDDEQDMAAEGDDQEAADDEIRNDIANALLAFKENKDMLEQAREQNPPLYDATLTMLRSMIAMAKKLGYAPEQDMADQEANAGLQEDFPEAGVEDSEMPAEDDSEEQVDDESAAEPAADDKEAPPAKK